jgi:hypothetical protein
MLFRTLNKSTIWSWDLPSLEAKITLIQIKTQYKVCAILYQYSISSDVAYFKHLNSVELSVDFAYQK